MCDDHHHQLLLANKLSGIPTDTDFFGSDEFRMYCYKVIPCSKRYGHDWTDCPFCHPGEKAQRRCPNKYLYTGIACPDMKKTGDCPRGDNCCFAHNVFEYWLHPSRYRTQLCSYGQNCKRTVCFFAHSINELRIPTATPAVEEQIQSYGFSLDTQLDFDGNGFGPATFLPVPQKVEVLEQQVQPVPVGYATAPGARAVGAYPRVQPVVTSSPQVMQYTVLSGAGARAPVMSSQAAYSARLMDLQPETPQFIELQRSLPMNTSMQPTLPQLLQQSQAQTHLQSLPSNVILQSARKASTPPSADLYPMVNGTMNSPSSQAESLEILLRRLALAQQTARSSPDIDLGKMGVAEGKLDGVPGYFVQLGVGSTVARNGYAQHLVESPVYYETAVPRVYDFAY